MKYSELEEINKNLKTIDVKGKEYVEVNKRILAFRKLYEEGRIETDIQLVEGDKIVIKASVYAEKNDERPIATGIAYEKEGSSFINKTSYVENCETSAIGRALGILGIGIDTSVASYEEVANAITQQEDDKTINKPEQEALICAIKNNMLDVSGIDKQVLEKFGYKDVSEIKIKDYKNIVEEFRKLVG